MSALLEEAMEAHGGRDAWSAREHIDLQVSCGGPAFATKGHPAFSSPARVYTTGQRVELGDFTFGARTPRPRGLRWSRDQMRAFAGAALWTYVSFPFVLDRPGFRVRELPRRRLEVIVPREVHSHARRHVLWLGDDGRIRRHDYVAESLGRLALAANAVLEYERVDGLALGARREVRPRVGTVRLPGPRLVWIRLAGARSRS